MFPEAPRALVTCPEKMMRKNMSAEANPAERAQAREKTFRACSVLPAPRSRVKRLRAPATITAPMMEKAIMSGLMIPKAAMESTPRNWPITTPSIIEPTDEESESRIKAVSCM